MNWINKLERKFGRYAIRNLMHYIVILYAVGLLLWMVEPRIYYNWLRLDPGAIMRGQVWRLLTFLLFPPALANWQVGSVMGGMLSMMELLIAVIILRLYYNLGQVLENVWGSFRFNLFFFTGIVGQILAVMVSWLAFGQQVMVHTGYLNASLFLAFAVCFPEMEFLLFFVLPVKAKWLGIVEAVLYAYDFIKGNASIRCVILFSLANVIIFFLSTRSVRRYAPREIKRRNDFKRNIKIQPRGASRHKCAVCGRTEKDSGDLEFRYCSKCAGDFEYCQDHLYTHQHVTDSRSS